MRQKERQNPRKQFAHCERHRFLVKQQLRQRRQSSAGPAPIFRADLLNYSPTAKSGFLIPGYGFANDPLISQYYVIETWHKLLSKHDHYKPILVNESDSYEDVLNSLKKETNKLLKGYSWALNFEDGRNDLPPINLCYWKAIVQTEFTMCPLDWLYKHPDLLIQMVAFPIIKAICEKFKIEIIQNYNTSYCLDELDTDEELRDYLVDNVGYNEDDDNFQPLFNLYRSYKSGEIYHLFKKLNSGDDFMMSNEVVENLELIKRKHPKIYKWLNKGLELFHLPNVNLHDFIYQEDPNYDERGVNICDATFFPYSFTDEIYDIMTSLIDETANNTGIEYCYEWGFIGIDEQRKPSDFNHVIQLLDFMNLGNDIYQTYYNKTKWK